MRVDSQKLIDQLLAKNIKPSHNRLRILEYFYGHEGHPTADIIYRDLKHELPTLSKTTVYNTLNLFVETGLLSQFNYEDNEAHYEMFFAEHGHFKCDQCGKLYDFDYKLKDCLTNELEGFTIKNKEVFFRGICKDCLKNKRL